MSKTTIATRLLATVALTAMVAACQTTREQEMAVKPETALPFLDDKPAELKKHFFVSLTQGKRNQVLNDMRLGLAAMELGHYQLAEEQLDDALHNIETIYADNEHAAKARQLFTKELVKDFKGEPYERAMAYYYRGLLYLKAGDYDNARASFKAGFIQDSFADEDQNRADFGLLQYLQGWASKCRDNKATAEEDLKEFRAINEAFPLPKPDDNVLVLVETGSAPVKYSGTDPNSSKARYLKLRRASATESGAIRFTTFADAPPPKKGQKAEPPKPTDTLLKTELLEDVYRQASTRGGREFDAILAGKAQFKAVSDTVGNVALIGAGVMASQAAYNNNRDQAAAAGVLLLVGLMAKAAAEATEPDADIRYWDNLPDRVQGLPLKLPATVSSLDVDFLSSDGTVLRSKSVPVWRAGACGLAWARGDSAVPASPRAPNSAPPEVMYKPVEIPVAPPIVPANEIKKSEPPAAPKAAEPQGS